MFDLFPRILSNLTSGAPDVATKTKDDVARVLSLDPERLAAFERSYRTHVLTQEPEDDVFHVNSRQASERNRAVDPSAPVPEHDPEAVETLVDRVVEELLAQTSVYVYNGRGRSGTATPTPVLPAPKAVTNADVLALPKELRPQLTGNLMTRDVAGDSGANLLGLYADHVDPKNSPERRRRAYDMFRQGLDILDLDALTYAIIETNRTSMGYWLPRLVDACAGKDFFRIPATKVARVPLTLLQLTRLEYRELTPTTLDVVDRWARQAFDLVESETYFIKTGTYSSKFDFRNAKVTGAKEVRELGEYLLYIHYQALQMASPLATPTIYGASTTTEWVVREFIEDPENNPTIYKGLPLRTEYRVFVDCDAKTVLGCAPYWDPETMKRRFGHEADANSPHQIHDYIIYKAHEDVLMRRYAENKADVVRHVAELLPDLDLEGQWSIDVMQSGDTFWLIDMAPAEQSAFYEKTVPPALRRPVRENWLPDLPAPEKEDQE